VHEYPPRHTHPLPTLARVSSVSTPLVAHPSIYSFISAGLVAGKLDQRQSCLQVHDVASRDVRPSDTRALADALGNW
jgi:hypothetical protein